MKWLFAVKSAGCAEQQLRRIIFFAGKDAMDIDHLGEKVVVQLFHRGFVKAPADLYRLTEEQFYQLRFQGKVCTKSVIQPSKVQNVTLDRVIMGLRYQTCGCRYGRIVGPKSRFHRKIDADDSGRTYAD